VQLFGEIYPLKRGLLRTLAQPARAGKTARNDMTGEVVRNNGIVHPLSDQYRICVTSINSGDFGMLEIHANPELDLVDEEYEVVQVDKNGTINDRQRQHCQKYVENLGNGVSLEMVLIPAGIFGMGTPGFGEFEEERPHHTVRVSAFLLGKFPVTQEQWKTVMDWEPPYRCQGPRRPVDRVDWKDALEFCRRLSKKTGHTYRLPNEAEWEYACRAGTATPFHYGETLTTDLADYVGEHTYQLEPKGIYRHGSTEVGSFPPNAFGLYDLHGNVWEWCADQWHDDYVGAPTDGSVWESGNGIPFRVMRGGSWHEPPANCRSATRLKMDENEAEDFFGFRVALTSLDQDQAADYGRSNKLAGKIKALFAKRKSA
jgi:formylglycine-generating enzyme required for sulfatase activity